MATRLVPSIRYVSIIMTKKFRHLDCHHSSIDVCIVIWYVLIVYSTISIIQIILSFLPWLKWCSQGGYWYGTCSTNPFQCATNGYYGICVTVGWIRSSDKSCKGKRSQNTTILDRGKEMEYWKSWPTKSSICEFIIYSSQLFTHTTL